MPPDTPVQYWNEKGPPTSQPKIRMGGGVSEKTFDVPMFCNLASVAVLYIKKENTESKVSKLMRLRQTLQATYTHSATLYGHDSLPYNPRWGGHRVVGE